MEKHTIDPFYNKHSKVLILGSFPSVKSREANFYYAHPQNRFWKVLASIYHEEIVNKKEFLNRHGIALFDVCATCEIKGSSDASIKKAVCNDISLITNVCDIKLIILNGKTATKLFNKFVKDINIKTVSLPSTSSANAKFSLNDLVQAYQIIKEFTD